MKYLAALLLASALLAAGLSASAHATTPSTITVRARGSIGTETISLSVNGAVVASWEAIGAVDTDFTHTVARTTTVESIQVHFDNDGGWPNADRNVLVDHLDIDGVRYQAESPSTFSTGTWQQDSGCAPGFKQSPWLHCNGYLDFADAQGVVLSGGAEPPAPSPEDTSMVTVRMRGATGVEEVTLSINGRNVTTWSGIGTSFREHTHAVEENTVVENLRVHFTNDAGSGATDRNVLVDYIEIDGTTFQTEDSSTYSTGTWQQETGCAGGFKRSQWLHCNGYLEYRSAAGVSLAAGEAEPPSPPEPTDPPPPDIGTTVILDTDMGPDIDDGLALALLHGYQKLGLADLAAVTISRNSETGAYYADAVNTFYGRPDIPIGVYRGSTPQDDNDWPYTGDIVGSNRYAFDLDQQTVPEAYRLMRQVLADAADGGVVIVQIGFSVNVAALLRSGPDDISPLTGRELVERKVSLLSIMAGDNGYSAPEFNVAQDVAAARHVFEQWPGHLYQSEANLGYGIHYPLSSILNDFTDPNPHIVPDSYLNRDLPWHVENGDSYDMRTWDLTSVMAAVENPNDYFRVSEPGRVVLDAEGLSTFVVGPDGRHRTLGKNWYLTNSEKQFVVDRMIEVLSQTP